MSTKVWEELQSLDTIYLAAPCQLNPHAFIAADNHKNTIMIYDSRRNIDKSWTRIKLSTDDCHWTGFIAHDTTTNTFYKYYRTTVTVFVLNRNAFIPTNHYECPADDVAVTPVLVFAQGKLHIFGGFDNKSHLTFDAKTKLFETVHEFTEWKTGNVDPGIIHIKSKNELLLLGGFDKGRGWTDEVWKCKLGHGHTDDKPVWNKLEFKLPEKGREFRFLLTHNERYIICGVHHAKDIYYWDINASVDEWKKSLIEAPGVRITYFAMTGDREYNRKIVDGFVAQFDDLQIPTEIAVLIFNWYGVESVHVLDSTSKVNDNRTLHWKCDIRQIIPFYK